MLLATKIGTYLLFASTRILFPTLTSWAKNASWLVLPVSVTVHNSILSSLCGGPWLQTSHLMLSRDAWLWIAVQSTAMLTNPTCHYKVLHNFIIQLTACVSEMGVQEAGKEQWLIYHYCCRDQAFYGTFVCHLGRNNGSRVRYTLWSAKWRNQTKHRQIHTLFLWWELLPLCTWVFFGCYIWFRHNNVGVLSSCDFPSQCQCADLQEKTQTTI